MSERHPGFCHFGKLFGVTIRMDWTFPAAIVFAAIFAGFGVVYLSMVMAWGLLFEVLHLLFHAFTAKCCRLRVFQIDFSLVTPRCNNQIPQSMKHGLVICSVRILTHLVLLIAEVICLCVYGIPWTGVEADLVSSFTLMNCLVLMFCIVPWEFSSGKATDSLIIYRLLRYAMTKNEDRYSQFQLVPAEQSPVFSPGVSLLTMPELIPQGFELGVEILNDQKTPMSFVLNVLVQFFDLEQVDAYEWMATIHNNGGILVALPSLEKAAAVADAITAEANLQGYPLDCRVVDARVKA